MQIGLGCRRTAPQRMTKPDPHADDRFARNPLTCARSFPGADAKLSGRTTRGGMRPKAGFGIADGDTDVNEVAKINDSGPMPRTSRVPYPAPGLLRPNRVYMTSRARYLCRLHRMNKIRAR